MSLAKVLKADTKELCFSPFKIYFNTFVFSIKMKPLSTIQIYFLPLYTILKEDGTTPICFGRQIIPHSHKYVCAYF